MLAAWHIMFVVRIVGTPGCVLPGTLPPVPCRDDLAHVAQTHFSRIGRAAEVGVFHGDFSALNLKVWEGEYVAVDSWNFRPGISADRDKNFRSQAENDANYRIAASNIAFAGKRAWQLRLPSLKAAATFPPDHFDWLYIDALHTYQGLISDLYAWWPKLRPGGLLSGDDYGDARATPMMTARRWEMPRVNNISAERTHFTGFGNMARHQKWGVIRATQEFAAFANASLHVTWMPDCYPYPAWYMVKPGCA